MKRGRGFTLIEMVVTTALVGLLALLSLPLYEVVATRAKESELRQALRQIRDALDAYRDASARGLIGRDAGEPADPGASGYPPSLRALADGVQSAGNPDQPKLRFLRRIPRDPFAADPGQPAEDTWALRSYASAPDAPQPGNDVYDVMSRSTRVGSNGIPYREW
ncbi:type II secretion system protein [Noviherbaspirillum pedocola]|uniref:Type II secretion system protein n=1 Tax=Noviherbaspirillum pedocola TaxID=2801341 RepID=A0A934W664_9BURK|nr:type II secretion system protein [Noviherbaspirillum pedocola]MBK4735822.1 type II secretion system protein [Noviherbaspirillum pedocola]